MSFETLGLSPAVLQAVKDAGYENATDVQAQAIPAAIANKDLMVSSRTGSGKTAAFILPALEKIDQAPEIIVRLPAEVAPGAFVHIDAIDAREHRPAQARICGLVLRQAPPHDSRRTVM